MPPQQTTTFIPKQPVASPIPKAASAAKDGAPILRSSRKRRGGKPIGILVFFAGLILVVVLVLIGALFGYQYLLKQRIAGLEQTLARVEQPVSSAFLDEVGNLHGRINGATELLNKHVAISPAFEMLEKLTLQKVRYAEFSYAHSPGSSNDIVTITGEADDYTAIANQSRLYEATPFISSHVFSGFTLQETGKIRFNLELVIKSDLYLYSKTLGELPLTRR